MKKNVLLLSLLSLLGIVTSCYDDSELRERIEKLENTTIPSINEQISSIRSSITELQNVDNAVKNSITELQNADAGLRQNIAGLQKADEGLGTEIENLKGVDAQHQRSIDLLTEQEDALSTQIANLQTYVDSSLVSQKEWAQNSLTNQAEWVSATFTTLEQYASVVGNVATLQVTLDSLQAKLQADLQTMDEQNAALFAGVNERIDSLAKALMQTESSLKTWVGEQFANYYDIAAVDARLAVINDSIVKGDERLTTEVASVRTALAEAQKELTTAYQTAIRTAIEDYNGTITKQIASDIATVNGHIDDEVKRLDDRIDAVEKRVSELEGKVAELLKTLDITFDVEGSVAYSPGTTVNVNYTLTNADATTVVECLADAGWKATVKQTSSTKGSISVETPSAGGEGKVLVFANKGDRTVMKVLRFEQGILHVLTDMVTVEPSDTLLVIETHTNIDYQVIIPIDAQSWIELQGIETRAVLRTDAILLAVKPNLTSQSRMAVISLVDIDGKTITSFTIYQKRITEQTQSDTEQTLIIIPDPDNPSTPLVFNFNTQSGLSSNGYLQQFKTYSQYEPDIEVFRFESPFIDLPYYADKMILTVTHTLYNDRPRGEGVNAGPYFNIHEFYLYNKNGQEIVLTAADFLSNAKEKAEGSYNGLCDRDIHTFFHSQWSSQDVQDYHNLQISIPKDIKTFKFAFECPWNDIRLSNTPTEMILSFPLPTDENEETSETSQLKKGDTFEFNGIMYTIIGENLIENPSFDDNVNGWLGGDGNPLGMALWNPSRGVDGGAYIIPQTDSGRGGNASIGMAWPIEKGKTYVFSYYINNTNNTSAVEKEGYIVTSQTDTPRGDETLTLMYAHEDADHAWTQNIIVTEAQYEYLQFCARWLGGAHGFDAFILAEVRKTQ